MPITETITAGKRGALPHEKASMQHTFATNKEALASLNKGEAPTGFDSIKEFMDCARAHKRVTLQQDLRPGEDKQPKVNKTSYED